MLRAIALILAVLWVVGLASGARLGIWLHGFLLASLGAATFALAARRPTL